MKNFRRGTPAFGLLLGALLAICGALVMWIGFWRTLLLAALFAAGYFIGAVGNKSEFVKDAVDRVVPRKAEETIDFRREVEKQQDIRFSQDRGEAADEFNKDTDEDEE